MKYKLPKIFLAILSLFKFFNIEQINIIKAYLKNLIGNN